VGVEWFAFIDLQMGRLREHEKLIYPQINPRETGFMIQFEAGHLIRLGKRFGEQVTDI